MRLFAINYFGTDKKKVNVQPKMVIELLAISEFLEMSPAFIVEEVVVKLMTVITSHDQKLCEFLKNEISDRA